MSLNLSIHNIAQVVGKCKITNYTASFYGIKPSDVPVRLYVILRLSLILVLFECSRVRVACFALVLVHIVCIPITGTSVNPARSIGPALFEGGKALSQLWLFIVAPFAGAALSALVWKVVGK